VKHLGQHGRKEIVGNLFAANELLVRVDSFKWMNYCQEVKEA
jgi:hypothetical protein